MCKTWLILRWPLFFTSLRFSARHLLILLLLLLRLLLGSGRLCSSRLKPVYSPLRLRFALPLLLLLRDLGARVSASSALCFNRQRCVCECVTVSVITVPRRRSLLMDRFDQR